MSQNKTVIQGLEAADTNIGPGKGMPSDFYSRDFSQAVHGTVVPGMEGVASAKQPVEPPVQQKAAVSGKPVVGFLYSVSRTSVGEYWPLVIGPNAIGQGEKCEIRLSEATVSSSHAVIVTRKQNTGIIAAIFDDRSTNGTMINGEMINFQANEIKTGDIITIGNNYELVVILIDAEKMGLKVSENFIAVKDEQASPIPVNPNFPNDPTRQYNPYQNEYNNNAGGPIPLRGTVGMDGSYSIEGQGGTKPM